ncbi:GAF domain-containing protein [Sulfurimonas sp. MAG313]|nr:GAF domain-containing protein [Sulfurimonas sp. MAG313]MDF1881187.1 GAF domain-containing protein [Sulfurimonas sp. MAG313]
MYKNIKSFSKIADFGRKLLDKPPIEVAIPLISNCAKELLDADRCSVFIYNEERKCLWTIHSDGVEKIKISANEGIVGASFQEDRALIVNDPYNDPRFSYKIDKDTGYVTHNIITLPIRGAFNQPIGVMQLLNKNTNEFNKEDKRLLTFFNHYISGYLELAIFFSEEKS